MYRRISICDIFRTKAQSTAGLPACLPVDCLVCRSIAVAVDGVCVFEYFKGHRINFASIWLYFSARFRSFAHFGIYLLFVFVFGIVFIFLLFHLLSLSRTRSHKSILRFVYSLLSPLCRISLHASSFTHCIRFKYTICQVGSFAHCRRSLSSSSVAAGLDPYGNSILSRRTQCCLARMKNIHKQIWLIIIYINDKCQWRGSYIAPMPATSISFVTSSRTRTHSRQHRRINTLINGYRGARRHQIGIFAEWVREVDVRSEHEEGAWGRDNGKRARARATTNSACCYLLAKMKSRKSILKSENATKINTRERPSSVDVLSVVGRECVCVYPVPAKWMIVSREYGNGMPNVCNKTQYKVYTRREWRYATALVEPHWCQEQEQDKETENFNVEANNNNNKVNANEINMARCVLCERANIRFNFYYYYCYWFPIFHIHRPHREYRQHHTSTIQWPISMPFWLAVILVVVVVVAVGRKKLVCPSSPLSIKFIYLFTFRSNIVWKNKIEIFMVSLSLSRASFPKLLETKIVWRAMRQNARRIFESFVTTSPVAIDLLYRSTVGVADCGAIAISSKRKAFTAIFHNNPNIESSILIEFTNKDSKIIVFFYLDWRTSDMKSNSIYLWRFRFCRWLAVRP